MTYSFRGVVHYYHCGTWWHTGKLGAGEGAELSTSCAGIMKWAETLGGILNTGDVKHYPHSDTLPSKKTNLFQQGHTS